MIVTNDEQASTGNRIRRSGRDGFESSLFGLALKE